MAERPANKVSRDFDFPGASGQQLAGILDLPETRAVGFALFAHCFTCTKSSLAAVRITRALAARGIGTLRFDFTGLGQSEGDFADTDFSSNVGDLVAAAGAMSAAAMAPQILIGHSLGGAAVLAAATAIKDIAAVVTIGAPFDVEHVRRLFGQRKIGEIQDEGEAAVRLGANRVTIRRSFLDDLAEQDQAPLIETLGRPLLIFHSPDDEVVGLDQAAAIYRTARHPKSFIALDKADHLLTAARDAEFVAEMIAAWTLRYLKQD